MSEFSELGVELDREAWDWLYENHPKIADTVQLSVQRGKTPEEVRAFVMRRVGPSRIEFAKRCENAARHLGAK